MVGRKKMNTLSNEKGFTLIEVIASIVIFSVALLLLSSFFTNSFILSKKQDTQMIAMNLARQTAEQWKSGQVDPEGIAEAIIDKGDLPSAEVLNYEELSKIKGSTITLPPSTINGRTYLQKIQIQDFKPNPEGEGLLLLLTVTVTEQGGNSNRPLAVLHTAIANPNP
jgi:prepilin-type N-terminal cleavage/methylation domain-containing protein